MVFNKKLLDKSFLDNILIFLLIDIAVILPLFIRLESLNIAIGLLNVLQIYVLLFTFFFNRILWTSPYVFLFYFLIGTSISLENEENLNF